MADVTMYPKCIYIYYIDLYLTPGIDDLQKENLYLLLNDNVFDDFYIEKLDIDGQLYRIRPYNFFNIQDEVRIQINKPSYNINSLRIYISKYFYNGGGIFLYKVPQVPSGIYSTSIMSVNDLDFILKSSPITICNGISPISYIYTDKTIYNLGEDITGYINLFDNDGLKAPDGTYIIKVAIEKLE